MERLRHFDPTKWKPELSPHLHAVDGDSLPAEPLRDFKITDHGCSSSPGDFNAVPDVIAMTVCHQNELWLQVGRSPGRLRVTRQKRIDQ